MNLEYLAGIKDMFSLVEAFLFLPERAQLNRVSVALSKRLSPKRCDPRTLAMFGGLVPSTKIQAKWEKIFFNTRQLGRHFTDT